MSSGLSNLGKIIWKQPQVTRQKNDEKHDWIDQLKQLTLREFQFANLSQILVPKLESF